MKKLHCIWCASLFVASFTAKPGAAQKSAAPPPAEPARQQASQPTAPAANAAKPDSAARIDPAKEADIRKLLEVTGAKALALETMTAMSKSIKPALTNSLPPGAYREKLVDLFFQKFLAKADSQTFLDLAIPSYDKNFTHEEIRGLIQFYQTPLGKKSTSVLPQLTAELQEQGRKWGEELGRSTMMELLAEHPEFEQQMAEAQKAAQPKN
jgi:uncharacterized protein